MQEQDSLLDKKIDSKTTKPSDNDKLGNLPIIKHPLTSIIHEPQSPNNHSGNHRRNIPQELIDEANRQRELKAGQVSRKSVPNLSDIYVNAIEKQKLQYIQRQLNAIKFTTTVNEDHGLPFSEQKKQDAPFGLLCRGLTS